MSRFDAVIFDMDGVIVDSEPIHEMSFLELWQEMGYDENHGIRFSEFYGKSDRVVWEAFIDKHQPIQSIEELTVLKEDRVIQLLRDKQPVFDGIPNLVQRLVKCLPLAIASGSVHRIIDVPNSKPEPDVFLLAAKRLGVARNKCCVIEDTVTGVLAGKAAGMTVLGITNTFDAETLAQAGADQVFEDYLSIGDTILK